MQWTDGKNAGFSDNSPWLGLNPNYTEINVAEQEKRDDSVLAYYRRLIALRKSPEYAETFTYGKFIPAYEDKNNIFAYMRTLEGNEKGILVVANYGKEDCEIDLKKTDAEILLTNMNGVEEMKKEIADRGRIILRSCEAAVLYL